MEARNFIFCWEESVFEFVFYFFEAAEETFFDAPRAVEAYLALCTVPPDNRAVEARLADRNILKVIIW